MWNPSVGKSVCRSGVFTAQFVVCADLPRAISRKCALVVCMYWVWVCVEPVRCKC